MFAGIKDHSTGFKDPGRRIENYLRVRNRCEDTQHAQKDERCTVATCEVQKHPRLEYPNLDNKVCVCVCMFVIYGLIGPSLIYEEHYFPAFFVSLSLIVNKAPLRSYMT